MKESFFEIMKLSIKIKIETKEKEMKTHPIKY